MKHFGKFILLMFEIIDVLNNTNLFDMYGADGIFGKEKLLASLKSREL